MCRLPDTPQCGLVVIMVMLKVVNHSIHVWWNISVKMKLFIFCCTIILYLSKKSIAKKKTKKRSFENRSTQKQLYDRLIYDIYTQCI